MSAPTPAFAALACADWRGVMKLDHDPQEEPLVPAERPEEKGWRDYSWEARRSITNAERCPRHGDRRVNLMVAQNQLRMALERLG